MIETIFNNVLNTCFYLLIALQRQKAGKKLKSIFLLLHTVCGQCYYSVTEHCTEETNAG